VAIDGVTGRRCAALKAVKQRKSAEKVGIEWLLPAALFLLMDRLSLPHKSPA